MGFLHDLGNIMDRVKHEQDEEQQAFLSGSQEDSSCSEEGPRKSSWGLKEYLRLILEIGMAFTIVILSIRPFRNQLTLKSSPVPSSLSINFNL